MDSGNGLKSHYINCICLPAFLPSKRPVRLRLTGKQEMFPNVNLLADLTKSTFIFPPHCGLPLKSQSPSVGLRGFRVATQPSGNSSDTRAPRCTAQSSDPKIPCLHSVMLPRGPSRVKDSSPGISSIWARPFFLNHVHSCSGERAKSERC